MLLNIYLIDILLTYFLAPAHEEQQVSNCQQTLTCTAGEERNACAS